MIDAHGELLGWLLPGDRLSDSMIREGQFHYAVVGSERVVSFARTDAAAQRLPARGAVLRALAHLHLGVAVPECLSVAAQGDAVAYLLMTKVSGAPLDGALLRSPDVAESVARQCHGLLDSLAVAGNDPHIRASLSVAPVDRWQEFAAAVRGELYPLMSVTGRARAERELSALDALPHSTDAVVHGDLGGENLLWDTVDGLPVLRGVVDWDGVCLGDPAEDFAAIGAGYGPDVLRGVLACTETTGSDLAARIAAIQGTFALQQALDAHRDGDEEELADGLSGYR
ncbi:phosphotransferase family protein [Nocardia ninae]|uniref:phosphotransferase family protein n=1 Tax=Nocardia ninae TaxID=356145 RepID=UPI0035310038